MADEDGGEAGTPQVKDLTRPSRDRHEAHPPTVQPVDVVDRVDVDDDEPDVLDIVRGRAEHPSHWYPVGRLPRQPAERQEEHLHALQHHDAGREHLLEQLNRDALTIAAQVASAHGALLAGNVCNTNVFDPDDPVRLAVEPDVPPYDGAVAAEAVVPTADRPDGSRNESDGPDA